LTDAEWVQQWLERALDDLDTAQLLYNNYRPRKLEVSCYQCQQAAEKALKAYLTHMRHSFKFTHDLLELCVVCGSFDEGFRDLEEDCSDISHYATDARYPNKNEIDEAETKTALRKAERIVRFCAGLIGPASPAAPPAEQ
jgi:HEPN domain-containing protein